MLQKQYWDILVLIGLFREIRKYRAKKMEMATRTESRKGKRYRNRDGLAQKLFVPGDKNKK
jgi:hypothetical protein